MFAFEVQYGGGGDYDPEPPLPPAFVTILAVNSEDLMKQLQEKCPDLAYTWAKVALTSLVDLNALRQKGGGWYEI
jgi:hypothetical protein